MKEGIITYLGNRTKGSTHKNAIEANITNTGDEHLQLRKKLGHQVIYNCIVHRNKLSIKYNVGVLHMHMYSKLLKHLQSKWITPEKSQWRRIWRNEQENETKIACREERSEVKSNA